MSHAWDMPIYIPGPCQARPAEKHYYYDIYCKKCTYAVPQWPCHETLPHGTGPQYVALLSLLSYARQYFQHHSPFFFRSPTKAHKKEAPLFQGTFKQEAQIDLI